MDPPVHLLSSFVSNRRKRVIRNGGRLSCQISDRRAYTLPLATALRRKRHRPSFQTRGEFLSDATKTESAEIVKSVVGRLDSKIAGVVRNEFLKMRTYAICKLKNEFALLKEKPIFL